MRIHRIIEASAPGTFDDDTDFVGDQTDPAPTEWIAFGPGDEHRDRWVRAIVFDGAGAILDRGDMSFSYEMVERTTVQLTVPGVGVIPAGSYFDTDPSEGVPMRKILYRAKTGDAALRVHTFADVPVTAEYLVLVWGKDGD